MPGQPAVSLSQSNLSSRAELEQAADLAEPGRDVPALPAVWPGPAPLETAPLELALLEAALPALAQLAQEV